MKQKKTPRTCGVGGCSYATEKMQSLVTHKLRVHCGNYNVTEITMTGNSYLRTTISTKRKHTTAASVAWNLQSQNVTAGYICNSVDCGRAFYSERGLSVHQRTCHKRKAPVINAGYGRISGSESTQSKQSTEVIAADIHGCHLQTEPYTVQSSAPTQLQSEPICPDNTSPNHRERVYDNLSPARTRKTKIKTSFSSVISDLEKEFIPSARCQPQKDHQYDKLKSYHDVLLKSTSNTTTEKLSSQVLAVVSNPAVIDDCNRQFLWSKDDENRLNDLNKTSRLLEPRSDWTWDVADDTEQGKYNDKRMQLCVTKECEWKLIDCNECQSTGLLVGDQTDSTVCHDCLKLNRVKENERKKTRSLVPSAT